MYMIKSEVKNLCNVIFQGFLFFTEMNPDIRAVFVNGKMFLMVDGKIARTILIYFKYVPICFTLI